MEFKGYAGNDYIHYKITSKGSHFVFEIIDSSKITNSDVYFPYIKTQYNQSHASFMSGIVMNENYSINLRIKDAICIEDSNTYSSYIKWRPVDGDFGTDRKVYVTVGPTPKYRKILQQTLLKEDFPTSEHGGPFALDSARASESYVFAYVTEKNVDDWIQMCLKYGIGMIHFSPAYETLGHYEPNKAAFPSGREGWKTCVDKIHAAGLLAGVHTLSGAIQTNDKYITCGTPHKDLAVDFKYKLKKNINEEDTFIETDKAPEKNFDTVFTYSGRGNVIRIGDELISYSSLRLTSPYGFDGCTRGAYHTTKTNHFVNDDVKHMFIKYTFFQPELNSPLVNEIAQNIANMYDVGFDYIYHDGAEGMPNKTKGIKQMREAIFRAIKNPGSVESSSWNRGSWTFHSRIGAYDVPQWGIKRFVDRHVEENLKNVASLLPTQMGWWSLLGGNNRRYVQQIDEFEYMCCKTIANDMSVSFQSLFPDKRANPKQDEMMDNFKKWETLRRNKILTNEEKEIIKKPREEFHIEGSIDDNKWSIMKSNYPSSIIKDNGKVSIINPYNDQSLKVRVQTLLSLEPYNSDKAIVLTDLNDVSEFKIMNNVSIKTTLSIDNKYVKDSHSSLRINVKNDKNTSEASWTKLTKKYATLQDVSKRGLGFWIYGDGKGEVINFQLNAGSSYSFTYDEHYVIVDFKGWKYIEMPLLERDADKYDDYSWPYFNTQALYINTNFHGNIDWLDIYVNNVPAHSECTLYISQVKALPVVSTTVKSMSININEQQIQFNNLSIQSGDYIEYIDKSSCSFYSNSNPNEIQNVSFTTNSEEIKLASGINELNINFELENVSPSVNPRLKLTVFEYGDVVISRGSESSENQSNSTAIVVSVSVIVSVIIISVVGFIVYKKFFSNKNDEELEIKQAIIV